jgi:hypothetical protein
MIIEQVDSDGTATRDALATAQTLIDGLSTKYALAPPIAVVSLLSDVILLLLAQRYTF